MFTMRFFNLLFSFGTFLLITLLSSCSTKLQADLIVHHAKIYSVDSAFSINEAMAIKDKKIIATGSDKEILSRYESADMVDAGGKTILPGFIDAHCHFTGFATDMWKCNLVGTNSFSAIIEKVIAYSKTAPMEWIYGRGWDRMNGQ
jgi:predicted amidohydrolase YtcJ